MTDWRVRSDSLRCGCGALVELVHDRITGRVYKERALDRTDHECPVLVEELERTCLMGCICGRTVRRDVWGTKLDYETGAPHVGCRNVRWPDPYLLNSGEPEVPATNGHRLGFEVPTL